MRIARVAHGDRVFLAEVAEDAVYALNGDIFSNPTRSGEPLPLKDVAFRAPVVCSRLLAILGGFVSPEKPRGPEDVPRLAPKIVTEVTGDGDAVVYPDSADILLGEPEMVVVVGRRVHRASVDAASDAILGFACMNEVTAPEFAKTPSGTEWYLAKSGDTFAPMGPWIETSLTQDKLAAGLEISIRVNGTVRQTGNTKYFKFSPAEIVSYLSQFIPLNPGDAITLGTPPPAPQVKPGDVMEVVIDGIGTLTNHVVAESQLSTGS
jgi:2-keto-4-pentenoate hydratase/2-oxohepta-3-ene-1,7-dioic acid hydratase in catechol pathway